MMEMGVRKKKEVSRLVSLTDQENLGSVQVVG
jgi:hypothetical protein